MLEVETKFRIVNERDLKQRLQDLGAIAGPSESHADTYFRHPCRDFVQTREALRVRIVDSVASVTYKGRKVDLGSSAMKARKEIEWCLAPADAAGHQMSDLLNELGFEQVATVRKKRVSYRWPSADPNRSAVTVTIDHVDEVGSFAEAELLIPEESGDALAKAQETINDLAAKLGLSESVRESYLQMLVDKKELDRKENGL